MHTLTKTGPTRTGPHGAGPTRTNGALVAEVSPVVPTPPTVVTHWTRIPLPNGGFEMRPGKPVVQEEEIGTAEAAEILRCSKRRVAMLCDEGVLVEGRDWRKNACLSGRNGKLWIRREAVMRLRNWASEVGQ